MAQYAQEQYRRGFWPDGRGAGAGPLARRKRISNDPLSSAEAGHKKVGQTMKSNAKLAAALLGMVALAVPAFAQDLTADEAAGKVIFEVTAGDVGCAMCHAMDGTGDVGPGIQGASADVIKIQFEVNEDMGFIELTDEELAQVVAYLAVLAR